MAFAGTLPFGIGFCQGVMMPAARKMDSLLALLGLVNYFPIQREDVGAEGRERRRVERKHAAADQPVAVDVCFGY